MPGFYVLSSSLLFFLFVPLVVMYFLKMRRQQVEVPSLVLWRKVLADQRVNSPFQRFKKHLLLLLQLLLLAVLILAAMQPYIEGDRASFKNVPILIDHSASMGARSYDGSQTRLEEMVEKVERIIDNLQTDQRVCLIAFADSARKLTDFTNNKRLLLAELEKLTVWDVESEVEDAIRMVEAMRQREKFDRVLMYTDGNVPEQVKVKVSFDLNLHRVDRGGMNVGLTALSAKQNEDGEWEIFANIESSGSGTMTGEMKVMLGGELIVKQAYSVAANEPDRVTIGLPVIEDGLVEVVLIPDGFDSLDADNKAYLAIKPTRNLVVGVSEGLDVMSRAMRRLDDVEFHVIDGREAIQPRYDLAVLSAVDRREEINADVTVIMGGIPKSLHGLLKITGEDDGDYVAASMKQSELLRHIYLESAVFVNRVRYGSYENGESVREEDLEERGWEVLADGSEAPLVLRARLQGKLIYAMLFDMSDSTLPFTPTPPMIAENLKQIAKYRAGLLELNGQKTGVLDAIHLLDKERSYTVAGPKNVVVSSETDVSGTLSGVEAKYSGMYQLRGSNRLLGASLLSEKETNLSIVDTIRFEEHDAIAVTKDVVIDKPIWYWFAIAGLAFLIIEWWFYQRKPGGWSRQLG
ncbi:vWA domain-containing protein [Poriferisphaera corsica]|nr:VWA domain-containing protein [Poriferisphaera corsica]